MATTDDVGGVRSFAVIRAAGSFISLAVIMLAAIAPLATAQTTRSAATIRVGPQGDVRGEDSFALQLAADELARRCPTGGGVLLIQPGTYTMHDSLHVRIPMTIRGSGPGTVLKKSGQVRARLLQDFDLSEFVARVDDAAGLRVGMGVAIKDKNQQHGWAPSVRTIVGIDGNNIRLDRRPERDYGIAAEAWMQNSFPLISARNVSNVVIENLVADGNREQNAEIPLDGCRGGAIYLNEAKSCIIRRCIGRNFNTDGISWQTTEDILVEDCTAEGNAGYGIHPGTGSLRSTVRNCRAINNGQVGLFVCWGVRHGVFENNRIESNGQVGISIGHKDTDNLFVANIIRSNGWAGVLFRDEPESSAPHRCTLRDNVIEDNGRPAHPGVGIRIMGRTADTSLQRNTLRDTRPQADRTQLNAIEIGPNATNVNIAPDNAVEGKVSRLSK